jgi:hypothetical protein
MFVSRKASRIAEAMGPPGRSCDTMDGFEAELEADWGRGEIRWVRTDVGFHIVVQTDDPNLAAATARRIFLRHAYRGFACFGSEPDYCWFLTYIAAGRGGAYFSVASESTTASAGQPHATGLGRTHPLWPVQLTSVHKQVSANDGRAGTLAPMATHVAVGFFEPGLSASLVEDVAFELRRDTAGPPRSWMRTPYGIGVRVHAGHDAMRHDAWDLFCRLGSLYFSCFAREQGYIWFLVYRTNAAGIYITVERGEPDFAPRPPVTGPDTQSVRIPTGFSGGRLNSKRRL